MRSSAGGWNRIATRAQIEEIEGKRLVRAGRGHLSQVCGCAGRLGSDRASLRQATASSSWLWSAQFAIWRRCVGKTRY